MFLLLFRDDTATSEPATFAASKETVHETVDDSSEQM